MKTLDEPVGDMRDESSDRPKSVQPPDGGWGWVVTISSFFISMVVDGVIGIFGIFYQELLSAFGGSKGKTQAINSVMFGTLFILAPVSGIFMEKYGARKVAICGGLVSSTGMFLSTFSPNLDVMILLYGFIGGYSIPFSYLPAQGTFIELSSQESALLISIIGISGTLLRILIGYISGKPWVNTFIFNSTMMMIGGLATCFVPYYTSFNTLAVYSAVYGAVAACFATLMTINLVKLMGLRNLSRTVGLQFLCMGIGSLIGSPIAGVLSENSRNYNNAFYFGGVVIGLAGLVYLPLSYLAKRKQTRAGDITGFTNRSFTLEQTTISLESFKQTLDTSA